MTQQQENDNIAEGLALVILGSAFLLGFVLGVLIGCLVIGWR